MTFNSLSVCILERLIRWLDPDKVAGHYDYTHIKLATKTHDVPSPKGLTNNMS
jgi:hypothetical protein